MRIRCGHSSAPQCPRRKRAGAECRPDPAASRVSGAPRRRARGPPCSARASSEGADDADDAPVGKHRGPQRPDRARWLARSSRAPPIRSGRSRARRRCGQRAEQGLRASLAPMLGAHEEILEPHAGAPKKRREIVEKQREGGRLAASFHASQDLGRRARAEQRACSDRPVLQCTRCGESLVLGQARIIATIASTSSRRAGRIRTAELLGFVSASALRKSTCISGRPRSTQRPSDRGSRIQAGSQDPDVAVSKPALHCAAAVAATAAGLERREQSSVR